MYLGTYCTYTVKYEYNYANTQVPKKVTTKIRLVF